VTRSAATIATAVAVSAALVVAYAALEQIALSTADGAACDLGVSREELVLALGSESDLDRFAGDHGITRDEAEDAVRRGLVRAIDDAEQADAIGGSTASVLRGIADHLPMGIVLAALRGASSLLPSGG
jgi:hypothetical protein